MQKAGPELSLHPPSSGSGPALSRVASPTPGAGQAGKAPDAGAHPQIWGGGLRLPTCRKPVINFPVLINCRISPSHDEAVGGASGTAGPPGSEERFREGLALLIASPGLRWAH